MTTSTALLIGGGAVALLALAAFLWTGVRGMLGHYG